MASGVLLSRAAVVVVVLGLLVLPSPCCAEMRQEHAQDTDVSVEDDQDEIADSLPQFTPWDYVIKVNPDTFNTAITSQAFAFVNFCALFIQQCRFFNTTFAELARDNTKNPDVAFVYVDVGEFKELGVREKVTIAPTTRLYKQHGLLPYIDYLGRRFDHLIQAWLDLRLAPSFTVARSTKDLRKAIKTNKVAGKYAAYAVLGPNIQPHTIGTHAILVASELSDVHITVIYEDPGLFPNEPPYLFTVADSEDAEPLLYQGPLETSAIHRYLFAGALPPVLEFDGANLDAFGGPVKETFLLLIKKSDPNFNAIYDAFSVVAPSYQGRIMFIFLDLDRREEFKLMLRALGMDHRTVEGPTLRIKTGDDTNQKFKMAEDKEEVTEEKVRTFAQAFLDKKLKPYYLQEPVPADWNSGPVKVVTGLNFHDIVLESPDPVVVFLYSTRGSVAKQILPKIEIMAKHLAGHGVLFVKMDGVRNEVPGLKWERSPTILFYPRGASNLKRPITFTGNVRAGEIRDFIKAHTNVDESVWSSLVLPSQQEQPEGGHEEL